MTLPSQLSVPLSASRPVAPRGFSLLLLLACVGAGAAQMTAALLTLALKADQLDASTATTTISLSSGIAGVFTLVALPLVGTLSDRSRSRAGRRRPFLLGSALAFVAGGALLVVAPDVPTYVVAQLLTTLGFVGATITCTALLTDQLPADRRGPAAALVSLGTPLGALAGLGMTSPFGSDLVPLVALPTGLAVVCLVLLAVAVPDRCHPHPRPRVDLRQVLGMFWVNPLRHRDFAWVFTSRVLVFSGVAALNIYQPLFLMARLHVALPDLGRSILLTVVVNAGVTLLVAPAVGRLSDRVGARKPFIVVAALVFTAGLVLAAVVTTFPGYLLACAVVGLGQGVYFAVELALATQVLPDPENPAKDLGLVKVADNLPQTLVAAVAPALIALGVHGADRNWSALFLAGAAAALLGGFAVTLVRGAR